MAAHTINSSGNERAPWRLLEDITITNQVAASTTVTKAVKPPGWAKFATFVLNQESSAGSGETLLFTVGMPAITSNAELIAPDDAGDVALITGTAITGNGNITQTYSVGPGMVAGSGSATLDAHQGANIPLPPWLTYSYTTTDTGDDADYAFTISVYFE